MSVDEATHHLEQTLRGSRWENIRGWHIFRHSFISNCAAKGIDQRTIDRWLGHQTEEMRPPVHALVPQCAKATLSVWCSVIGLWCGKERLWSGEIGRPELEYRVTAVTACISPWVIASVSATGTAIFRRTFLPA